MQDVTPKKSLKDIFPQKFKKNRSTGNPEEESNVPYIQRETTNDFKETYGIKRPGSGLAKIFLFIFIIVVLVFGGFALSSYFAKAIVKVTPKNQMLAINGTYQAVQTGDGLHFSTISQVVATDKKTLSASGSEMVQRKAQGTIVVYNNYDSKTQTLVKNTRFQATNGKIYRIVNDLIVPGQTKDSQGNTVPGSVTVTVTADQAGPDYNQGLTDFTIPGFKGGARYTKFYARSKTPMSGGFIGQAPKVSESDKTAAEQELKQSLTAQVAETIRAQVPGDVVLFDDGILTKFDQVTSTSSDPTKAELVEKVTATAILFKKTELAQFLASQMISDFKGDNVDLANWSDLKFTLNNKDQLDPANPQAISFNLAGNGKLVWLFDENDLKNKLRSANSDSYKDVLRQFPIQLATINFEPPWIRTVPDNPNHIMVELQTPNAPTTP